MFSAADRSTDTGTSAGSVTEGGTLTMALSAEPDFLDPTLAGSFYSRYVFNAMCEKLYDVNADTEVVPQLAASMPKGSQPSRCSADWRRASSATSTRSPATHRRSCTSGAAAPVSGCGSPRPTAGR